MSLPVRCFSCGTVIGHLEEKYLSLIKEKVDKKKALESLNVKRYCCRRMFLGYVDISKHLLLFPSSTISKTTSS